MRSDTQPNSGNPYGASKLIGKRIGKSFSERHGISSANERIGWNRRRQLNIPSPDTGEWGRQMCLSDGDHYQIMERCINARKSLGWTVINGVSKNTGTKWDLTEVAEQVGYNPVDGADNAEWSRGFV